jgi:hypothetical protein
VKAELDRLLRLSDAQLETLTAVAGKLPLRLRPRFLEAIAGIAAGELTPSAFHTSVLRVARETVLASKAATPAE